MPGHLAHLDDEPIWQPRMLLRNSRRFVAIADHQHDESSNGFLGFRERSVDYTVSGRAGYDTCFQLEGLPIDRLTTRGQFVVPRIPPVDENASFSGREMFMRFRSGIAKEKEIGSRGGLGGHGSKSENVIRAPHRLTRGFEEMKRPCPKSASPFVDQIEPNVKRRVAPCLHTL